MKKLIFLTPFMLMACVNVTSVEAPSKVSVESSFAVEVRLVNLPKEDNAEFLDSTFPTLCTITPPGLKIKKVEYRGKSRSGEISGTAQKSEIFSSLYGEDASSPNGNSECFLPEQLAVYNQNDDGTVTIHYLAESVGNYAVTLHGGFVTNTDFSLNLRSGSGEFHLQVLP